MQSERKFSPLHNKKWTKSTHLLCAYKT